MSDILSTLANSLTGQGLPTKCYLSQFTIKGNDVRFHVNTLQIFESICKPYLTAIVTFLDNNDILNRLQIVGGEQVQFTLIADGGKTYTTMMQIFSIKGEKLNPDLRSSYYKMELIGPEYFGDKQNLVQQSFKNITGTDIIQKIHQQYVQVGGGAALSIPVASTGLLGSGNAIVISSAKPFKAIDDIRRQLVFGQYQTGSTVYYHDNKQVNLVPLEYLLNNISSQQTFIQTATLGKSWTDVFTSTNIIMEATTNVDPNSGNSNTAPHGRLNMMNLSAALNQEIRIIDIFSHKRPININTTAVTSGAVLGTSIASLVNLGTLAPGGHGGRHNYFFVDTEKVPPASIRRTDKETLYKALMTSGPQIIIKVPIQTGLNVTVGKGFTANLLPPMSDLNTVSYQPMNGGQYVAINVEHECHFDDEIQGTTTIHGMKMGVQVSS